MIIANNIDKSRDGIFHENQIEKIRYRKKYKLTIERRLDKKHFDAVLVVSVHFYTINFMVNFHGHLSY